MNRPLVCAGILGASAIALGAWAAHGLPDSLEAMGRDPQGISRRVENFDTGARYQLSVALACLAVGCARPRVRSQLGVAVALLTAGGVLFAVLLYAIALGPTSWRWLGAVVPLGGLAMIAGWAAVAVAGFRLRSVESEPLNPELVRLEELLTHQQQLWQDLDEGLRTLRDQSDDHQMRVVRLENAARQLYEQQQATEPMPDEKPPHY